MNIIRFGSFTWKLTELSSTPENILAALNFRALPSVPDTHHLEPITLAVTGSTVITARTLAGGRSVTDTVVESSSGEKSSSMRDLLMTYEDIAWGATGIAFTRNILLAIIDMLI